MRISTKRGDNGESSLFSGKRVAKSADVFEVLGGLDELNAFIGLAKVAKGADVKFLARVQNDIYGLMALIGNEMKMIKGAHAVNDDSVAVLEKEIGRLEKKQGVLRKFVTPGEGELSARLHVARVVCRRAERAAVRFFGKKMAARAGGKSSKSDGAIVLKYLNRLSDLLFLMAVGASR